MGEPISLLKLQTIATDPISTVARKEAAVTEALNLGLETCVSHLDANSVGIDPKGK